MSARAYLIGIAGPSGAGKSFLATHLAERLHAPVLSLDHYYRDLSHLAFEQRVLTNFDEPTALEHELLITQIRDLQNGREIAVPSYDFSIHTRIDKTHTLQPAPYVIIEGLFTLYWPELRSLLNTRVYVETAVPECFERRLERDVRERGRTPESVTEQYHHCVWPMAKRYVIPTREYADVFVDGTVLIDASVSLVLNHARKSAKKADHYVASQP